MPEVRSSAAGTPAVGALPVNCEPAEAVGAQPGGISVSEGPRTGLHGVIRPPKHYDDSNWKVRATDEHDLSWV